MGQKLNVNQASKEDLMQLEGVGEETAEAIVNYRESHGRFEDLDDLDHVFGIGGKKLDDLKSVLRT